MQSWMKRRIWLPTLVRSSPEHAGLSGVTTFLMINPSFKEFVKQGRLAQCPETLNKLLELFLAFFEKKDGLRCVRYDSG